MQRTRIVSPVDDGWRIPDALWMEIEPLLPKKKPHRKGGRPWTDDRQAMDAMYFLLRTGCQWKAIPRSLGAASTVHDRFHQWAKRGVWETLWKQGLIRYDREKGLDMRWQSMDGAMTKAPLGGKMYRSKPHG